jgi:signal transduction histidine kinase
MPDDAVVVDGDAARLELVLRNLLQNAVQYSPAGGVILVTLEHGDVEACLSIQDHGVGIPREALARIFGRFYRARDTSVHTATGMGVGLYIVKQIVESHGGYVDVQSVEGAGSTFRVCLPLHHPHEHANEVSI